MKNFNKFTNDKYDVRINWLTRKMKTLFKLKDPCIHPACNIYLYYLEFVFVEKYTQE